MLTVLALLGGITQWLEDVSSHQWFYALIFVIAYLDSVIPIVPSETTVILGGIAAGQGDLTLAAVIAVGALGASLGDNSAYMIGKKASEKIQARYGRTDKGRKRLEWAREQIETRGALLLITARFIPGGRTVITISSGITRQKHLKFALFVSLASIIWATYAAVLGYWFGERFKGNHTKAFVLAFTCALSVTVVIELVRFLRKRSTGASAH
jgi:membrane protein DedA with SNARE-associated domain